MSGDPKNGTRLTVINSNNPPNKVNVINPIIPANVRVFNDDPAQVVRVVAAGPPGGKGERGIAGPTGSTPPFYIIEGTTDYASTSSLALYGSISSSLLPYTSSNNKVSHFSLGSPLGAWKDLYLGTGSIYFMDSGSILGNLEARQNELRFGSASITTSSFGFVDKKIIIRNTDTDYTVSLTGSVSVMNINNESPFVAKANDNVLVEIDNEGRLIFKQNSLSSLSVVTGSIAFLDGEFYVGID